MGITGLSINRGSYNQPITLIKFNLIWILSKQFGDGKHFIIQSLIL